MSQLDYRLEDRRCYLSGELSFDSVAQSEELLRSLSGLKGDITLSFAEVTHADSAATALMVEAYRRVSLAGGELRFEDIPQHLLSVLAMTRLDTFLPIHTPSSP